MIKQYKITVNGKLYDVSVEEVGEIIGGVHASKTVSTFINVDNTNREKQITDKPQDSIQSSTQNSAPIDENAISVKAPMPGTILSFTVSVGDSVLEGQVVAILEAMKMENELIATASGKVKSILVEKGSSVVENQIILQIS